MSDKPKTEPVLTYQGREGDNPRIYATVRRNGGEGPWQMELTVEAAFTSEVGNFVDAAVVCEKAMEMIKRAMEPILRPGTPPASATSRPRGCICSQFGAYVPHCPVHGVD